MSRRLSIFFVATTLFFGNSVGSEEIEQGNQSFLIENLKGVVLFENSCLEQGSIDREYAAPIDWVGLNLPGNPKLLQQALLSFVDQPLSETSLGEIKKTVTDYYAACGRHFVVAYIPEQDITTGVLQVGIMESCFGKLSVEGNKWTSSKRLERYFSIQPGDPIDQSYLIQGISFINRNPFRRADLVFAAGEYRGTTDLIIAVKDRRPLRIYAGADNTGVEAVGENRWYAGFNWGNAFGLDHVLSYQFTASDEFNRFQAHTFEYDALLSWKHLLKIYGGYSEVHPRIHDSSLIKRNDGWSLQACGRYVVPLKITQYLEHELGLGADFKRSNNTFEFAEISPQFGRNVNLLQFVLGYSGNYERNQFRLDFLSELNYSPGQLLADQSNADYESLRPGAVNHWVYFRGALVYLQRLPGSFSISCSARGQASSEPLLPSEQFGLGGYSTVRGYEEREINADNAVLLNTEVRSPGLPISRWVKPSTKIADALQFLTFIDYGWGEEIHKIPGAPKSTYLLGVGPGLRYTLEPYVTARLDWGIRLHNDAAFAGNWNRIHFNVTASY